MTIRRLVLLARRTECAHCLTLQTVLPHSLFSFYFLRMVTKRSLWLTLAQLYFSQHMHLLILSSSFKVGHSQGFSYLVMKQLHREDVASL